MAPKAADDLSIDAGQSSKDNSSLIPDAGKVHIGKNPDGFFNFKTAPLFPHLGSLTPSHRCYMPFILQSPPCPGVKGLVADFKSTIGTYWKQEMTNFNQKSIAVSLLMFISVFAPTLTFGAVYGRNTQSNIGVVETILATSWVGCFFSLFSGMPTVIVGSTGPVLIMTTVMVDLSKKFDIPFLPFYAWVSIWLFLYCSLTAFFDLTRFIRYATRFTDDIFALLIVSIFILNAIGNPFAENGFLRYLDPFHPVHENLAEDNPDNDYSYLETSLLSIMLGLATTATIFFLRGFKASRFFCNQGVRNSVHDFAVIATVILFTLLRHVGFSSIEVQGLAVPARFEPTYKCCSSDCNTLWPEECEDQEEPWGTRPWFAQIFDLNCALPGCRPCHFGFHPDLPRQRNHLALDLQPQQQPEAR